MMLQLPKVVGDLLDGYTTRRRRLLALRVAAETLLVLILGVALISIVDLLAKPGSGTLSSMSILMYAGVVTTLLVRGVIPLARPLSTTAAALEIEQATGGRLEERLSSAVELSARPDPNVSRWMVERTVALAANEAATLDPENLIDTEPLKRAWYGSGALLVLAAIALVFQGPRALAFRVLVPGLNLARPSVTELRVSPGDTHTAQGESLTISVEVSPGEEDAEISMEWQDGAAEYVSMRQGDRTADDLARFTLQLPSVTQGFTYTISSGDAESRRYGVVVDEPPRLKQVRLRVVPPHYTVMPERYIEGGEAEVLDGSEVIVTAELAGAPTASASLVTDSGVVREMTLSQSQASLSMVPQETFRYSLRFVGVDGLAAEPPHEWRIKVVPDTAPKVTLTGKGLESGIVGSDETVMLDASADDDVGLSRMDLLITCADERPDVRPLKIPEGSPALVDLSVPLDLGAYSLALGDTVRLELQATDLGGRVSRCKALELVAATGEQAKWMAIATRLRTQLKQLNVQEELLRQEFRTLGSMIRSFQIDDASAQRGPMVLAQRRLDGVARSVSEVSEGVRAEAANMDAHLGILTATVGDSIGEWARSQGGIMNDATLGALNAKPEAASGAMTAIRDLVDAALEEIDPVKRNLALLVSRVEAEALVGKSEAAHSRQARTAPVVRGYHGWSEQGTETGLFARFYRGIALSGEAVCQMVGIPQLEQYSVPGIGQQQWSVRYSGEFHAPEDGRYKFVGMGDDGIRLKVEGKSLFEEVSWKDQGPTSYGGTIDLKQGWHTIELTMYQNGGGSHLSLQAGLEGKGLAPVQASQFRCSTESRTGWRSLAADMASLPKGVLKAADKRLRHDFGVLAGVPGAIARMADDVRSQRLKDLAREQNGAAETIRTALSTIETSWTVQALDAASSRVLPLVWAAREARDILQDELAKLKQETGRVAGTADDLRRAARRALNRAHQLGSRDSKSSDAEHETRERKNHTALKAELEQMARTIEQEQDKLLDDVKRAGGTVGERRALLGERRSLEDKGEQALERVAKALGQTPQETASKKDQVTRELGEMLKALDEAEMEAERAAMGRQAQVASPAMRASTELAARRKAGDALGEAGEYRELGELVKELAGLARDENKFETASALEKELGDSPAELKPETLDRLIEGIIEKDAANARRDPLTVAERMEKELNRLQSKETDAELTAEDRLAESPLALAVAGEQFRAKSELGEAVAREMLARDLAETLEKPEGLTAEELKPLVERAKAIEGGLSKEAHDKELASAAERYAQEHENSEAAMLEELAKRARAAADQQNMRGQLTDDLKKAAEPALAESPDAKFAEARADALNDLSAEARQIAAELERLRDEAIRARMDAARARREFAEVEKKIAEELDLLRDPASSAAQKEQGELASALSELGKSLPKEASRIDGLAKKALSENALGSANAKKPEAASSPDEIAARAKEAAALARQAAELTEQARAEAHRAAQQTAAREEDARKAQEESRLAQRRQAQGLLGSAAALDEKQRGAEKELASIQDNTLRAMDASERASSESKRQSELDELGRATERVRDAMERLAETMEADPEGPRRAERSALDEASDGLRKLAEQAHQKAQREKARLDKLADAMAGSEGEHAEESLHLVADERAAAEELGKLSASAAEVADMSRRLPKAARGGNEAAMAEAGAKEADELARQMELASRAAEQTKMRQLQEQARAAEEAANDAAQIARKAAAESDAMVVPPQQAELTKRAQEFKDAARARLEEARDSARQADRNEDLVERSEELARHAASEAKHAQAAAKEAQKMAAKATKSAGDIGPRELIPEDAAAHAAALAKGHEQSSEAEKRAQTAAGLAQRALTLAQQAAGDVDAEDARREDDMLAMAREAELAQRAADEAQKAANASQMAAAEANHEAKEAKSAHPEGAHAAVSKSASERALDRASIAQKMAEAAQQEANQLHDQVIKAASANKAHAGAGKIARKAQENLRFAERNAAHAGRNAREAAAMAHQSGSKNGEQAAEQNSLKAAELQAQAEELTAKASQMGAAHGDEEDHALDRSNAALASEARDRADALQQEMARPLAEAYRKSGAAKAGSPVAKLGRDLAGLAAEQRRAADLLERSLARQDALRKELADELAAGEEAAARLGRSASGVKHPQPSESERQARAAQESSNRMQQAADAAQEQADSAQQAANAAKAQAEQARYAAEQLSGDQQKQQQQADAAAAAEKAAGDTQAHALSAQDKALDLQSKASASHKGASSAQAAALSEQAISNFGRAHANAEQAMQNASAGKASQKEGYSKAASQGDNARSGMIKAAKGQEAAAAELAKRLSSAGAKAQHAGKVQSAQAKLAGAQAQSPSSGAKAASQALSGIQADPGQSQSYKQAAQTLSQAAAQSRMASAAGSSPSSKPGQSKSGGPGLGQQNGKSTGTIVALAGLNGAENADWAKLPERVRAAIRSGGIERFSEEHQEAIRAYFRRLGEER